MDLTDRLLQHDCWTTRQLLQCCESLDDEQLDSAHDIGHGTLRATLDHIIHNMEVWSSLMASVEFERHQDKSLAGLTRRLDVAAARLSEVARRVTDEEAWNETWTDHLDDPPREKSYGTSIAHILTHSMHHRAQVLYMLKKCGVRELPEGDVFSWENRGA